MLVSGSDYADLANGLRQACTNLAAAGTDGITTADCAQVEKVVERDVPLADRYGHSRCRLRLVH